MKGGKKKKGGEKTAAPRTSRWREGENKVFSIALGLEKGERGGGGVGPLLSRTYYGEKMAKGNVFLLQTLIWVLKKKKEKGIGPGRGPANRKEEGGSGGRFFHFLAGGEKGGGKKRERGEPLPFLLFSRPSTKGGLKDHFHLGGGKEEKKRGGRPLLFPKSE